MLAGDGSARLSKKEDWPNPNTEVQRYKDANNDSYVCCCPGVCGTEDKDGFKIDKAAAKNMCKICGHPEHDSISEAEKTSKPKEDMRPKSIRCEFQIGNARYSCEMAHARPI